MKERIVGAIILVAVVVLVVPVFLDGPPGEGEVVTERVPLPGQSEQDTKTVVLARDRDEPVPATTTPEPVPAPPVSEESEPEPEPVEDAAPGKTGRAPQATPDEAGAPAEATSTTGMFAVQLGSFSNQENAERLAADLRKQGFAAFLSQLTTGSGALHRVRVGPQKDREAAEAMAARLEQAGHTGQVVPHP